MTLFLLAIPSIIAIAVICFLGRWRIVWWETCTHVGVAAILLISGWFLSRWTSVQDTEIWNGFVARKPHGTMHCCHSYKCNCIPSCTGSGTSRTCTNICQTCYRHSHDLYWKAITSNGEVIYRSTCNSPHTSTPDDWRRIKLGEPTAVEHRYTNYIKAAPGTMFKRKHLLAEYKHVLPAYPRVRGWHVDRLLFCGLALPDKHMQWNTRLMQINGELGKSKQVNIIIVITSEGPDFYDALAAHWLGGKKNDFIAVIGTAEFPAIDWVKVLTWSHSPAREKVTRRIRALSHFNVSALGIVRDEISKHFIRRPMTDFKYLMQGYEPPLPALIILGLIGVVWSIGFGWWAFINKHSKTKANSLHER